MTGDSRHVRLGALTVSVQLRAELAHNFTQSCWAGTEGACGVPLSQPFREATGPAVQSSKTGADEQNSGTIPKGRGRLFLQLFIHAWREVTKFENVQRPQFRIAGEITYILVGMLSGRNKKPRN